MKLKVPPPLVFLLFLLTMYLLATVLPVGHFDFFGRTVLLLFLSALGFLVAVVAVWQFYSQRTTISPHKIEKTNRLVTTGIYQYSRNPMYLALLLILIGGGLYLQNAFNALLVGGFVYYMNHFQIFPEEEMLKAKFGREYQLYQKAVRRWF